MQFDSASKNSELKLHDFAYKTVTVVRSMFKTNSTSFCLKTLTEWINEHRNNFKQYMFVLVLNIFLHKMYRI